MTNNLRMEENGIIKNNLKEGKKGSIEQVEQILRR